jgi:hypothetical protein
MAHTQRTDFRVDPDVIDAVRERYGLADAPLSVVVRYGLAVAGGLDPRKVSRLPRGRHANRAREADAA